MLIAPHSIFRLALRFLILTVIVVSSAGVVAAQGQIRPNVMVRVSAPPPADGKSATVYLATYAPDNATVVNHFDIADPNSFFVVSPNGKWIVSTSYNPDGSNKLVLGLPGGAQTELHKEVGYDVNLPIFSTDSRYLSYGLANLEAVKWQLVIVDLTSGKNLTFGGDFVFPPAAKPAVGFYGGPEALAFSADGKHVYVNAYAPSSDGMFGGPFDVDLNGFTFGQPGVLALPTVRPISGVDTTKTPFFPGLFSPDATKVIFATSDTSRPVPNYQGMGDPVNTFTVNDVASGQPITVIQANQDEGIENIEWSTDGAKITFMSGKYTNDANGGPIFDNAHIYVVDVASKQVSAGPVLAPDPADRVVSTAVCGDTFFFVIGRSVQGPTGSISTLYSAPMAKLDARSAPLLTGSFQIYIMTCVP